MVSVGIVFEQNSDYVYSINTIMNQTYDSMELICTLYEGSNISAYDILECIRIHRRNNIERVHIILSKQKKTFKEHLQDILQECKGKYAFFLSSHDAFYTQNTISNVVDIAIQNKAGVCGNTVFYSDGQYLKSEGFSIPENGIGFCEIVQAIQKSFSFLFFTEDLKELSVVNKESSLLKISQSKEPCLRHEMKKSKETNSFLMLAAEKNNRFLNYTDSSYLQSFLQKIFRKELTKEIIQDEIKSVHDFIIGKQNGGHWNVTFSDKQMLYFLEQIGTIINHKFFQKQQLSKVFKEIKKISKKQIKIAMLTQEYYLWPSLKSVYDAAVADPRFSVDLIHIPFTHIRKKTNITKELECYRSAGYPIKRYDEYRLDQESPDIVVYMKPYDSIPKEFLFNNIDKVVRRGIYIRYAPSVNVIMDKQLKEYLFTLPAYFLMWKCLAYTKKEFMEAQRYSYQKGKEWLPIGHPRDDLSFDDLSREEKDYYIQLKSLVKEKTVFVWNTAAHMKIDDITSFGSFLEWGEKIIEAFQRDKTLFLIWRPHPLFFNALNEIWGEKKFKTFLNEVKKIDNIFIDEYKQYTPAILLSDAFISDMSSLIDLYIPSLKPIMLTKLSKRTLDGYDPAFLETVYLLKQTEDIKNFLEMCNHKAHIKEMIQREYALNNYFSLKTDKRVSENLLDFISQGIYKEEQLLFCKRREKKGDVSKFI